MAWTREQLAHALAARRIKVRFLPRVGEPIAIYRDYFSGIMRMRESMIAAVRLLVVPTLEDVAANASRIATTDAPDELTADSIGDDIDKARRRFEASWPRERMVKVVEPIARDIAKFNARNLNKTLSAAIGQSASLDIVGSEPWIAHAVAEFVAENVALIRTIPSVFFSDLEKLLTRSIADGARWEDLAQIIEDRYDVTASRARLIAKDQVNKFVGDLNRVRMQDLGIDRFIWRTMGDERVRTDQTEGPDMGHRERNGREYAWADPPNGETPGEPINCRCYSEPVLPEIED